MLVMSFSYIGLSLFLFNNSKRHMSRILRALETRGLKPCTMSAAYSHHDMEKDCALLSHVLLSLACELDVGPLHAALHEREAQLA